MIFANLDRFERVVVVVVNDAGLARVPTWTHVPFPGICNLDFLTISVCVGVLALCESCLLRAEPTVRHDALNHGARDRDAKMGRDRDMAVQPPPRP